MDRPNSTSPGNNNPSRSGSTAPFGYQTRLLERTSSVRTGSNSLSRSNSQTSISLLTNSTGSSSGAVSPRRWTQTHRVTNSLDTIRGKWEERSKEALLDNAQALSSSPTKDTTGSNHSGDSDRPFNSATITPNTFQDRLGSTFPSSGDETPKFLKRRTMPAPIIATPLSPNTTGVSVEADSPSSAIPHRIRLPHDSSFTQPWKSTDTAPSSPTKPEKQFLSSNNLLYRSRTFDVAADLNNSSRLTSPTSDFKSAPALGSSRQPPDNKTVVAPRSDFSLGSSRQPADNRAVTPRSDFSQFRTLSRAGSNSALLESRTPPSQPPSQASPMFPAPYRSSYVANKKADTYTSALSAGSGRRRLGNHLPRIASGDGDESWPSERKKLVEEAPPLSPIKSPRETDAEKDAQQLAQTHIGVVEGVAGVPGRIQLKAPTQLPTPTPSTRFLGGGSWADKQRHLVQAYEYLCHVGEAQQWIEGCLGEELEFGVVELEEGLRNGVILAKLVRAFKGESFVKRIYTAPKLDYRHSDNINVFFRFLEEVGLPESFIFELTDLYNKKNLPKVIYCIHALSHLLARRGMAERIGNLLGRLHFSDDQLQQAQKGLKDAGVTLPNFGNIGRELAKEINEPEPEETEEERRDRMLLECEDSIILLRARLRGYMVRKSQQTFYGRLRLTERHVIKLQAHLRGVLVRRRMKTERRSYHMMSSWVISVQARCRGVLLRRRWQAQLNRLVAAEVYVTQIQAQLRGIIQRRRYARLKVALRKFSVQTKRLQSAARGHLLRHSQQELKKSVSTAVVSFSIVAFQAQAKGVLLRRRLHRRMLALQRAENHIIGLQAHCRGLIIRRRLRSQMAKLENVSHVVIRIQAAVRTYLARKRLLALIRGLRRATSSVIAFQALARSRLVARRHQRLLKALTDLKTIRSVGKLQTIAKASLVRKQHQELDKKLEVTLPDVIGFQSTARGALVRSEYRAWRDHLHRSHPVATILQAMLRGTIIRREFRAKMEYYKANLSKVVKIQSLFRAKEIREQYRQLTLGTNVTVDTIKNFVHLLDDSEADFQEEIKVERLRKRVVERIRENQALENEVHDLDTKIALVVQNVKSFEEVIKARGRSDSAATNATRSSLLAAHGDPFSTQNLDHDARRKLELYQQLLYLLQTRPEYLPQLLMQSCSDVSETNRRFIERVVLILFGYGQSHREEYLLLKFFQICIRNEIAGVQSLDDVVAVHPMYINIALHYVRPRQLVYVRDAFQSVILELVNSPDIDLESDPSLIHRSLIEIEEMRAGKPSDANKNLPFREAVLEPNTRATYIRHLQLLQFWTEAVLNAMIQSTRKMPYSMRYLIRETLDTLEERFPDFPRDVHAICVGKLVFYHYINPALVTPEVFDIVPKGINMTAGKKNLAQISNVLSQVISASEFDDAKPSLIPINDFVRKATVQVSAWVIELASIPDAEAQFHAHEFLDATTQPKPIYISPNEIYSLHSLLQQSQHRLAATDDALKIILAELGGVPHLDNEELRDARDLAVMLELTNRFANIQDPHAEEKTLWVQAKRGVLAILRVQPARNLYESLMAKVDPVVHEQLWEEILETEMEAEMRQIPRRQPSAVAYDSAYRLEDIRTLTYASVKASAIKNLLELERQGKITREDGFQGILNAIAGDVRSKHRKRLQRQKEMAEMNEVLQQLAERKKYFEEQVESYHSYVETAMNTMQRGKGKKRFVIPFTKQFRHLRELQRMGQSPQFGSYIYSAKELYDRGILLSIDQYSPRQFDKFQLTMSSDRAGIFTLVLESAMLGITARVGIEDVKMGDLLQARFEKRSSYALFGGKVKVNFELFLFQINKKFYT